MRIYIPNPILILAAVIPAIVLAVRVYRADKLEREPVSMLLALMFSGVVATALALVTERIGMALADARLDADSLEYQLVTNFIVVAVSEEGFKYLLLRRATWRSPAFDCQFDGIVYAVFVSLGFALWENISYVLMYGLSTALTRAVTAVPGHACFGVFMGAWYGLAKKYANRGEGARASLFSFLAFLMPAVLHGAYDFIVTVEEAYSWTFLIFIGALFLVSWVLVRRESRRDEYIR